MTTTKIVHIADTHLRSAQYSRADRGVDFQNSLRQVIEIAKREGVSAILQAGDLLDTNRPSSAVINFLADIHAQLRTEGIPMFMVNGDHDKSDPPWAELLRKGEGPHVIGGIRVLENQLITIPETKVTVYGQDFIGKSKERFLEESPSWPKATILLWHTMVQEFCGFPVETVAQMHELPLDKYKLIALGDLHICKYLQDERTKCWVGYPGSGELCKSDEPLEKSVTIAEFDETNTLVALRQVPLKTRTVRCFRINTEEDMDAVLKEVAKLAPENPIIFGRYNSQIPGVVARFHAALDPDKAIIRLLPIAERETPGMDTTAVSELSLTDLLPEFFTPGTDLFDLGAACLRPDAPVNELITAYIDKKLS